MSQFDTPAKPFLNDHDEAPQVALSPDSAAVDLSRWENAPEIAATPQAPAPEPKVPPEIAAALSGQEANAGDSGQPTRAWFSDESAAWDGSVVIDDKTHRPETVCFSHPGEALSEAIEDMPIAMAEMLGVEVEDLAAEGALDEHIRKAPYKLQVEAKRYLAGLYGRLRSEPGVLKSWTFQGGDGQVRPLTPESVEKLPPEVKQIISQAIMNHVLSGAREQTFTIA